MSNKAVVKCPFCGVYWSAHIDNNNILYTDYGEINVKSEVFCLNCGKKYDMNSNYYTMIDFVADNFLKVKG